MIYYNVAKTGTGASDDPFRPNVPDGVAWVGNNVGDAFIIGTDAAITGLTPLTDSELQNYCATNGISYSDATTKWSVT